MLLTTDAQIDDDTFALSGRTDYLLDILNLALRGVIRGDPKGGEESLDLEARVPVVFSVQPTMSVS
jgi:hypothetical protein